jgi:hypothetical protein
MPISGRPYLTCCRTSRLLAQATGCVSRFCARAATCQAGTGIHRGERLHVKRIALNSGAGELAWAAAFVVGVAFIAWLIVAAIVTVFI